MLLPVSSILQLFMQMHVIHAPWYGVNTFCSCVPYLQGAGTWRLCRWRKVTDTEPQHSDEHMVNRDIVAVFSLTVSKTKGSPKVRIDFSIAWISLTLG